ncbi:MULTISPECIES: fimbrial protein [Cupriavidus]
MNEKAPMATGRTRSARMFLAALALGLASLGAWADTWENRIATRCAAPFPQETMPWTVRNPLTSSTPINTILMERSFSLLTTFYLDGTAMTPPHQLIFAGRWLPGFGPNVGVDGIAPTDIDGIGFKWEAQSTDGVSRIFYKSADPIAVGSTDVKHLVGVGGSQDGFYTNYKQYLVLTKSPNQLPSGDLKVTRIDGGLQAGLYAVDFLTAAAPGLGSTFVRPQPGSPSCNMEQVYDSTGIVSIGGSPPPPIPNKCDVVANQIIPVPLGSFSLAQFPNVNSTSSPVQFAITLSNCTAAAKPTISFRDKSGKPAADKTVLQLYAPGGQSLAAGFGIIMTNEQTGGRIAFDNPNVATKYPMARSGDTATIALRAQYIRTGTAAELKAGYAGGSAEFTFTFP